MKYTITAVYKVKKEMEVEVVDGADPMEPRNWEVIEDEHDIDCWVYDVIDFKPS